MNKQYKQSEKGFAIALALIMMVVMSLMGAALVYVASADHKGNIDKDVDQQIFYAAEAGIIEAKKYLVEQSDAGNLNLGSDPDSKLSFCRTGLFTDLQTGGIHAVNDYIEEKSLSSLISTTGAERTRLSKYSYEFFITRTPDASGDTTTLKTKTVATQTGTGISESISYKKGGSSQASYYTIFSCGCNEIPKRCSSTKNTIVALQAVVTVIK